MKSKELRNKRYYLHKKAKELCRIDVYKRTLYCTDASAIMGNKYVKELLNEFEYVIQTEIS